MFICFGDFFHRWSRAFYDKEAREDYQICVECGRRRRAIIQFGGKPDKLQARASFKSAPRGARRLEES